MKIAEDLFFHEQIGNLVIGVDVDEETLVSIRFGNKFIHEQYKTELHEEIRQQLNAYFNRELIEFKLSLKFISGSPFQKEVWKALTEIPYGQVVTYKQIAEKIGAPRAYRAVGNANNKNPIPIVVPCHRVVNVNAKLGGYAPGLDYKIKLLRLEGIDISKQKIVYH